MNIKKIATKQWSHCACLRVSGILKWATFNGCALKIRILGLKVKLHLLT